MVCWVNPNKGETFPRLQTFTYVIGIVSLVRIAPISCCESIIAITARFCKNNVSNDIPSILKNCVEEISRTEATKKIFPCMYVWFTRHLKFFPCILCILCSIVHFPKLQRRNIQKLTTY